MDEFKLIHHYFATAGCARGGESIALGIGDDCALLQPSSNHQLAISTDSLVERVHFPVQADPALLAQRALAVNLSDLAAMGAEPLGFTLALTLPSADQTWLAAFAEGLNQAALQHAISLIGGDTTRGPLTLTLTVLGQVPVGQALVRSGAQVGDRLCVSGVLGAANLALPWVLQPSTAESAQTSQLLAAYWQPQPQLALGQALRQRATAALDISDGLLADAGHLAKASGVGLVIDAHLVPCVAGVPVAQALTAALTGGDDYHLVFTLPPQHLAAVQRAFPEVRAIGQVVAGAGVELLNLTAATDVKVQPGYTHF